MPWVWSWSATDRRGAGRGRLIAGFVALALGPAAEAATVLEKTIAVDVGPGGQVRESVRLRLRLETAGDLEDWAHYPIYLDENRRLRSSEMYQRLEQGMPDHERVI